MSLVILQPCGNLDAREHYDDTIKNPVNLETIRSYLAPVEYDELQNIYRNGEVKVWGVTPGKNEVNVSKWKRISPGDVMLLSAKGKVFACATTTYKIHNAELAKHLWDVDKNNRTWEYIYFVSEVTALNIPYPELNAVIPYADNYTIQGFNVLDEEKSNNILSAFNLFSETYYPDIDPTAYYNLLLEEKTLDSQSISFNRREQTTLRRILFQNKSTATCCICQKSYPVKFLVAAHIKMRSMCSLDEKKDFENIVAPMCKFGCDELYEKGYIGIVDSYVTTLRKEPSTEVIVNYIEKILGSRCSYWSEATKEYFDWHISKHSQ